MTEEKTKVEVKVGSWTPDGTFTGQVVRFTGEEIGSYTEYSMAQSKDDRGFTRTLYECPKGFRVRLLDWSRWQGEASFATLHPSSAEDEQETKYTTYTEEEARKAWPELFAATGRPNAIDLDEE